jgi:hypothetical protein
MEYLHKEQYTEKINSEAILVKQVWKRIRSIRPKKVLISRLCFVDGENGAKWLDKRRLINREEALNLESEHFRKQAERYFVFPRLAILDNNDQVKYDEKGEVEWASSPR